MRKAMFALPVLALFLPSSAWADDSFRLDDLKYTTTIIGIRDGKLAAIVGNNERLYDLDKVQIISLGNSIKFTDAEAVRTTDARKAAALYREAIRELNNPQLKQLAVFRAIEPADADGRWTDAVGYFLEVYQAWPVEAVWKARPTRLPTPSSSMLRESAERIGAAARTIKSDVAKKNLKGLQLEIYTRAGDNDAAQRLARELATGVADDAPSVKPRELDPSVAANAAITEIEASIRAKNYDAAIKRIDTLLAVSPAEMCVALFNLKARAYEEQEKFDLAAAALLRIVAHYPGSSAVPAALLQAANCQKKASHADAARALYQEIVDRFPDSREALAAKPQL